MSSYQQPTTTTTTSLDTQAFALMSRLHVALRRQIGRVTDMEYMRVNADYCRHVLDIAEKIPNEDVQQICTRLKEIYFGTGGLFTRQEPIPPLLTRLSKGNAAPESPPKPSAPSTRPSPPPREQDAAIDLAYIGRLR